jgi:hypothetical protein
LADKAHGETLTDVIAAARIVCTYIMSILLGNPPRRIPVDCGGR